MKFSKTLTSIETHMILFNFASLALAGLLFFIGPIVNLGYYGGISLFDLSFGENMQDMLYGFNWIGIATLTALIGSFICLMSRHYLFSTLCDLVPETLFIVLYFTLMFSEAGNAIGFLGWGYWTLCILFLFGMTASLLQYFFGQESVPERKAKVRVKDQMRFHTGGIQIPELAPRPVSSSIGTDQSFDFDGTVCTHCLKENESSALYCTVCGTPLTANKQA